MGMGKIKINKINIILPKIIILSYEVKVSKRNLTI